MNDQPLYRPWYTRIGPGLITACVVIGPGSILTSSKIGANQEYSKLWIVIVAVLFMMVYMTMGARLGAVAQESPCDLVRRKAGSWLAILVGFAVFFISAAFQFGNNLGVAAAFEAFVTDETIPGMSSKTLSVILVVIFNAIAISFLFAFKNFYKALERVMMVFVALMLISFAINLLLLKPNLAALFRGFIPDPQTVNWSDSKVVLPLVGLAGTTFVITAAFYQAYLVHQKGWTMTELKSGLIDARIGSVIMALITIMLISTAAAGLYNGGEVVLNSAVDVAKSLETTFGPSAKIIFCFGLFSAAYSSFIVNSMIGGFIFADGLGIGSKPTDFWPRIMTTLALLTGMTVGIAVIAFNFGKLPTIILAQAVTVVGSPLVAGVLLWLTSSRDVMGEQVNGPGTTTIAGLGFLLLIVMSVKTAWYDLPANYRSYQESQKAAIVIPLETFHDSLGEASRC